MVKFIVEKTKLPNLFWFWRNWYPQHFIQQKNIRSSAFLLGLSSKIDGQTFLATISRKSAKWLNELKSPSKNHSETTDPQKEGIANENIFVLIGKNQRQSSFIKYFLFVIQRQDLRSKTLRSKITFEHMIRPFKWFLWMKVA